MTTDPIRILVADDNADFRRGLHALLAGVDWMSPSSARRRPATRRLSAPPSASPTWC